MNSILALVLSIVIIILSVFSTSTASPTSKEIVFYFDSNYQGSFFSFGIRSGCHDLVGIQNDIVSSVNPKGNCFILHEHSNCRGKSARVTGSVSDLGKVGLNDALSSFELCP